MTKPIICFAFTASLLFISCENSEKQLKKSLEQAGFNKVSIDEYLELIKSSDKQIKNLKQQDF